MTEIFSPIQILLHLVFNLEFLHQHHFFGRRIGVRNLLWMKKVRIGKWALKVLSHQQGAKNSCWGKVSTSEINKNDFDVFLWNASKICTFLVH